MARWSKTQQLAVGWYAEQHNATPQLSTWPTIYFRPKDGGDEFSGNIFDLEVMYKAMKREENKQRNAAKKRERKK